MVAGELAKRSNVKFVLMAAEQDPASTPSCSPAVSKSYACPIYTHIRGYGLLFFWVLMVLAWVLTRAKQLKRFRCLSPGKGNWKLLRTQILKEVDEATGDRT